MSESHRFILSIKSVKPPNVILEEYAEQVDDPHEGDANEKKDNCDNYAYHIVLVKALADSVDPPNDVKSGDAEDELYNLRQIVKGFDKLLHYCVSNSLFADIRWFYYTMNAFASQCI